MSQTSHEFGGGSSRRDFIKQASAVLAAGTFLGTNARIARSANVSGSDEIKIALIGCGGRGTGAVTQALMTKGPVTLVAMADAFSGRIKDCLETVQGEIKKAQDANNEFAKDCKIDVPAERQFAGFDAYEKALASDADLVILATPPGFRPIHFEAAVKAGKHIFTEKPVAVDAPGVRRFLAANDEAKKKNLMVAVGLQRHHSPHYSELIKRIKDGAIGDILLTRVYWNSSGLWVRSRADFMNSYGHQPSEMEYQVNNWYYFNWLCGDHIVEQHIHNLDVGNWLRGTHPSEANGMGGRQVRTGKEFGQIYDHHMVEFTYPDGTKMLSQCRHMNGCFVEVAEHAHGTLGTAHSDNDNASIDGKGGKWSHKGPKIDAWQQEHHDLFAALRKGDIYNEGEYGAHSTMTAIFGRMATYSGKKLTWDECFNSKLDLSPAKYDFSAEPPVMPNSDGSYPVPVPGKTELSQIV